MNLFGQNELKILVDSALSRSEKNILVSLENLQGKTFSSVVKALGRDYPESTVKYILRKLAGKKIIKCGNNSERGLPLTLTDFGKKIIEVLK